ncbi:MAG: hypothetical protein ACOYK8_02780, partial [Alphaproteobacteria bacterium]
MSRFKRLLYGTAGLVTVIAAALAVDVRALFANDYTPQPQGDAAPKVKVITSDIQTPAAPTLEITNNVVPWGPDGKPLNKAAQPTNLAVKPDQAGAQVNPAVKPDQAGAPVNPAVKPDQAGAQVNPAVKPD